VRGDDDQEAFLCIYFSPRISERTDFFHSGERKAPLVTIAHFGSFQSKRVAGGLGKVVYFSCAGSVDLFSPLFSVAESVTARFVFCNFAVHFFESVLVL
jgi:hypothetical protein